MKKIYILSLTLILIMSVVSGCGSQEPKEILLDSIDNQTKINSMTYSGQLNLKFNLDDINYQSETSYFVQTYLSLFSNIELIINGKENIETKQSEMNINAKTSFQGMELAFDIPIIITENKMYIKVPESLKMLFSMGDKDYLGIDISNNLVLEESEIDEVDMLTDLVNSISDSSIMEVPVNDYNIEDANIDKAIQISINQDDIKQILNSFYYNILPVIMENSGQSEDYLEELNSEEEFNNFINELDSKLAINKFNIINFINQDGFVKKTIVDANTIITSEEIGNIGLTINYNLNIDNINQPIDFGMSIPNEQNVLNLEELENDKMVQ